MQVYKLWITLVLKMLYKLINLADGGVHIVIVAHKTMDTCDIMDNYQLAEDICDLNTSSLSIIMKP